MTNKSNTTKHPHIKPDPEARDRLLAELVDLVIERETDGIELSEMLGVLDLASWSKENIRELFLAITSVAPAADLDALVARGLSWRASCAEFDALVQREQQVAELLGIDASEAARVVSKYRAERAS